MFKIRFLVATLALVAGSAHADATLDFVDPADGAHQSRIAVADGKLRVDAAGASGGSYVVLDLKTRTLTQVNPAAHATASSSIEQMQAMIGSITRAADPATQPLVQFALDNLPDAQRTQAESMLRQSKRDEAIPYVKTGQQDHVAGISCDIYTQHSSSGDTRRLCVAPYAALKLAPDDTQTLQTALDLLQQTGGPWAPATRVPGLPIRYSGSFGQQAYAGAGQLRSISRAALAPTTFDDPPGYRIVSLFEMLSLTGVAGN